MVSSEHLLYLVLRRAACLGRTARCGPHAVIMGLSVGRGEHFGEPHANKSLRIALGASLNLTFGVGARLHAPFNASAVIKSLIKLMSDLPREPGVGETEDREHRQPSASNALMLQAVGAAGSHQQAGITQGCLEAG